MLHVHVSSKRIIRKQDGRLCLSYNADTPFPWQEVSGPRLENSILGYCGCTHPYKVNLIEIFGVFIFKNNLIFYNEMEKVIPTVI